MPTRPRFTVCSQQQDRESRAGIWGKKSLLFPPKAMIHRFWMSCRHLCVKVTDLSAVICTAPTSLFMLLQLRPSKMCSGSVRWWRRGAR